MHLRLINQNIKSFFEYWVFPFSKLPKGKNQEITEIQKNAITLKDDNVTSKAIAMLFNNIKLKKDLATLLII